jgi:molybdopterin converting factor subunit 1
MRVTVRYFAAVREALGRADESLEVPAGARLADLVRALEARHPALVPHRAGLRYAVAQRFAAPETPLTEGCDVALIPPVSGG